MMGDQHMAQQHLTEKLVKMASKVNAQLQALREKAMEEILSYQEWKEKHYQVTLSELGNCTVTSFDKQFRVELSSKPFTEYGDGIKFAQELMSQVIEEGTEGVNEVLRALFMEAFTPKKGTVNDSQINKLCQYKVPDERWQRAIVIINEEKTVAYRKPYLTFSIKTASGKWETIPLDIARVDTEEK